jgi:hypothetical protein
MMRKLRASLLRVRAHTKIYALLICINTKADKNGSDKQSATNYYRLVLRLSSLDLRSEVFVESTLVAALQIVSSAGTHN